MFDLAAGDYDRVEKIMALGTGSWYRRQALLRAGLRPGMRVLDVAIGTGLVAREEAAIAGGSHRVLGVDASVEMLRQARSSLDVPVVCGTAERLPVATGAFDFVSLGFALRHMSDMGIAFREFLRVLRPGGTLCVLELTEPTGLFKRTVLRWYMSRLVPALTRNADSQRLWEYYWDTIERCVPPPGVRKELSAAGFNRVHHHAELGIFSEFCARKPKGL